MNIGIVTVWYSENYGSFWQAKSLGDYLKKEASVFYMNSINKESSHSLKYLSSVLLKNVLKGNLKDSLKIIKKYREFDVLLDEFEIIDMNNLDNIDLLVFGSDTLWDMKSKYFRESSNLFWGIDFDTRKVAYAPSVANSSVVDLENMGFVQKALKQFCDLSVRDDYSKNVIENFTKLTVHKVCDPTLLFEKDHYIRLSKPINKENYILVYLFDDIDNEDSIEIIKYAKSESLRIIALGRKLNWADITVYPDPYEFLSYFNNAEIVITNTFHGAIFSLIFERNFISYGKNKNKVKHLLNDYNLSGRLKDTGQSTSDLLNSEIDYENIRFIKDKIRLSSQKFIVDSIFEDSVEYE